MKKLLYLFAFILILLACEKENSNVKVTYKVSNAVAETEIVFRNSDQNIQTINVNFQSATDVWSYSFETKKGEILYVSAIYQDSTSGVNVQILTDGKVYKQGSSKNEPGRYVTVSGTVPY